MKEENEKPLIGITCHTVSGPNWIQNSPGQYLDAVFRDYPAAIEFAGGIPILLPIIKNVDTARKMIGRIDGLLLTGGQDVSPRFFNEEPVVGIREMNYEQDVMELELVRQAEKCKMPVLGICRGIQVINVAFGGTLYQDIYSQLPGCLDHNQKAPKYVNTHKASVKKHTRLFEILEKGTIWVNSHHHQAVKEVAQGLEVSATAGDGIVEAIERPDYPFLLGIQWHAEGTWAQDEASQKIFTAFVQATRKGMKG